jgi:hypothetical protein
MTVEEARKTVDDTMDLYGRIKAGINSITDEQVRFKARFEHLEKERPLLQAAAFLGEIPDEKVVENSNKRAALRTFLDNAPLPFGDSRPARRPPSRFGRATSGTWRMRSEDLAVRRGSPKAKSSGSSIKRRSPRKGAPWRKGSEPLSERSHKGREPQET